MSFFKNIEFKLDSNVTLVALKPATVDKVLHAKAAKPMRTTQSRGPWGPQQEPLRRVFGEAGRLYETYAPEETEALAGIRERARAGAPGLPEAQEMLRQTAAGEFLYGGPGFERALQAAQAQILPEIQSRYARGGQFGSALSRIGEAKAIADVFAGQYGQERQRQLQAAGMIPALGAATYADLERLRAVSQEPWQRLERFQEIVGKPYGAETESLQYPQRGSRAGGILGGGLSGAQLGMQMGGPYGAAIGAGLGGLLGGFA